MRPELNKTYSCNNGVHVRIDDVYPDHAYGHSFIPNGIGRRIRYDLRGCPLSEHHGFTLSKCISHPEPELCFRLKTLGGNEVTVSEGDLTRAANNLHQEQAPWCGAEADGKRVLAAAALRMIELAKAPKPKPEPLKLDPTQSIRLQIGMMLRDIGLEPSRFLNDPEKDIKPVCQPETNSKAEADRAASELLCLLRDDLGITTDVSATILRLWLVERWDRVAKLAHKIHNAV